MLDICSSVCVLRCAHGRRSVDGENSASPPVLLIYFVFHKNGKVKPFTVRQHFFVAFDPKSVLYAN